MIIWNDEEYTNTKLEYKKKEFECKWKVKLQH